MRKARPDSRVHREAPVAFGAAVSRPFPASFGMAPFVNFGPKTFIKHTVDVSGHTPKVQHIKQMEATICAPSPPDPKETASAQTGTNVGTAVANAYLGNVSQVTPDGSLSYDQTGSHQWTDPYTGKSYTIPTFTATQTLSPEQQAIKEQTDAAQGNLAGLANDQSAFLRDYLAQPFEYTNQDVENWAYDLGSQRLDPRFEREEEALRTKLINSGIREGSSAWDSEMSRLTQVENDAYNQLMLQGRGQAFQEALTGRNQPINEITALLSGSQVSQPNFVNANMPTIPTTDTAGIINQDYANRVNQWGNNQQLLGGIMGAAGQLISLSDDKAKKNKKKVGETASGLGVYEYDYKGEDSDGPKRMGLMASDVERKSPQNIKRRNGLRYVNYSGALGA